MLDPVVGKGRADAQLGLNQVKQTKWGGKAWDDQGMNHFLFAVAFYFLSTLIFNVNMTKRTLHLLGPQRAVV